MPRTSPPVAIEGVISRRTFVRGLGISSLTFLTAPQCIISNDTLPAPTFVLEWGGYGKADGEFDSPVGIAVGPDDEVYVGEFRNQRVQRFTSDGKFLSGFAVQPHAGGVAVGTDGTVYVAHWNSNKVAAYSPAGELLREWGQKGTADGEFQLPGSLTLGPDGLIYVPDQGNSRVQKFRTDGTFVSKFGELGSEPGQFGGEQAPGSRFAGPQFVAFDRAGHVYTSDAALDRIQKFTPDGQLLGHWGSESSEPGGFGPPPVNAEGTAVMGGPIGLCVDAGDRVWVSSTNNRVQQFTNDGTYLRGLSGAGSGPGQFDVPHGLVLDSRGCLYVCDTMNDRIQKFAVA
jgi:sugar lactone lactonase YvrE